MTDDIVTRLLEQPKECEWCSCDCCEDRHCIHCENASLAADEIERLREELEASKSAISGFIEMIGKFDKSYE